MSGTDTRFLRVPQYTPCQLSFHRRSNSFIYHPGDSPPTGGRRSEMQSLSTSK
jgi:hypothetical protein